MIQYANSLETAADSYIAKPTPEMFSAVEEWLAASYENDPDYTEEDLRCMDFKSAAQEYIERRRAAR